MEYLQYWVTDYIYLLNGEGFKPCYKWNTFNTKRNLVEVTLTLEF